MFSIPRVLLKSALIPLAVLKPPVVLLKSASAPLAVLPVPVGAAAVPPASAQTEGSFSVGAEGGLKLAPDAAATAAVEHVTTMTMWSEAGG